MASFGTGFTRGFEAARNRRLQEQQIAEETAQARANQVLDVIDSSKKDTEKAYQDLVTFAGEAAAVAEPGDERLQQIQNGAVSTLMRHATVLEEVRQQMIAEDPALANQIPSGMEFVRARLPMLQAAIDTAQLQKEATPVSTEDFFAVVEGFGDEAVRVTKEDTTAGTVFKVGDQVVSAADVSQPTQKRTEIPADKVIPNLTPQQTGEIVIELRESIAANNGYAALASRLAQDVLDRPEKVGTVGDAIRSFGSLSSQVEGLARVFGLESPFEKDVEEYDFGALADETAEVKRTILDLVFLDLAAKGQTGRAVSDRDLEIFKRDTGIESGDVTQVVAGLRRGVENNRAQLDAQINAKTAGTFTAEELVPGGVVGFTEPGSDQLFTDAQSAFEAALESNDLDRAEAIQQALENNDADALREALGQ